VGTEVVVEKGDDDWKNYQIGDQQVQHKQIPVEPTTVESMRTIQLI